MLCAALLCAAPHAADPENSSGQDLTQLDLA
jgi:hypothetical protein